MRRGDRERTSRAKIEPAEEMATTPKQSSFLLLLLIEQRPIVRAIKKGTVMGPVVMPDESKAKTKNWFGIKHANMKISAYIHMRTYLKEKFFKILKYAIMVKIPTPRPITTMNIIFGILFTTHTILASIWMSGSARVAIKPKTAPNNKIIQIFLNFINAEPECFPILTIECSAPVMKSICPNKTMRAPSKKFKKISLSNLTILHIKHSPTTAIRLKIGIKSSFKFFNINYNFKKNAKNNQLFDIFFKKYLIFIFLIA